MIIACGDKMLIGTAAFDAPHLADGELSEVV
jgi:hypothetical protein